MSLSIDYKNSTLKSGIDKFSGRIGTVVMMYATTKSVSLSAWMKTNRVWTDRTGMAKALLSTRVSRPDDKTIRITLAHGVEYGIWLELANNKNYAIIGPAISSQGPEVVQGLKYILDNIKV